MQPAAGQSAEQERTTYTVGFALCGASCGNCGLKKGVIVGIKQQQQQQRERCWLFADLSCVILIPEAVGLSICTQLSCECRGFSVCVVGRALFLRAMEAAVVFNPISDSQDSTI